MEEYYLNHILYEIEMYLDTFEDYRKPEFGNKGQYYNNLVIECFCLHTRNLLDFFLNKENLKHPDDLILKKLVKNRVYLKLNKMEIQEAGILNKSICHLTMERKKEGRAKKCIIEAMNLSTSILPAIGQFLDDISQEDNVTDMIRKELSVSCVTDNIAFVKSIYNRIVSNLYFSNIVTTGCVTTI